MRAEELAVVRGWADTRATLRRWRREPADTVGPWAAGALVVAGALLLATWVVAQLSVPDVSRPFYPGVTRPATVGDFGFLLYRNGLVLALHALACVAGFLAGSSLPTAAQGHSGLLRRIHDRAGPVAIGFVLAATLFSLATQAYALGGAAATLSAALGIPDALLLVALLPHAAPELCALFMPLAAWTLASRRGAWEELLAAAIETWLTPHLLVALAR